MTMFGISQHTGRVGSSCLLRNLSTKPARVASRLDRATAAQDDRDTFGTLSESGRWKLDVQYADKNLPDDAVGYDKIEFDIEARKNAYYYKYEITKHARQGAPGLRRALELYQEMKAKARLEPTMDNFSPLIYGCAKAGYTKKAFDLYDESQRYLTKPSQSMITCLINSCAECPFPEYGIERLKWFLPHIKIQHNRRLNETHYNCAIKAFGKLGQLNEASKLVQEMIDEGVTPSVSTFNMLLIGCASNKEAGCSIALRVFKRLKMYQFKPQVETYRLMLRCIRDCGMGSPELIETTLKELPAVTSHDQRLKYQSRSRNQTSPNRSSRLSDQNFTWVPLISDIGDSIKQAIDIEETMGTQSHDLTRAHQHKRTQRTLDIAGTSNCSSRLSAKDEISQLSSGADGQGEQLVVSEGLDHEPQLPNLLSEDHLDLVMRIRAIKFDSLKRGADRLLLFGGLYGYLEAMMKDGCRPDTKTFSLILDCLVGTPENYLAYHKLAGDLKVKRDLLFYDLLLRHICERGVQKMSRLELALSFLEKMHLDELRPNITTFESLALGCRKWSDARRLLEDINKCGFIPSDVLVANLFKRAIKIMNFEYLNHMIDYCHTINFQPNKQLVDRLENLRLEANQLILQQEKNFKPHSVDSPVQFSERAIKTYDLFRRKLGLWLKSVNLKPEDHPWSQFKVDTSSKRDGMSAYAKHFEVMDRVKKDALEQGRALGNLPERARRLVETQAA